MNEQSKSLTAAQQEAIGHVRDALRLLPAQIDERYTRAYPALTAETFNAQRAILREVAAAFPEGGEEK